MHNYEHWTGEIYPGTTTHKILCVVFYFNINLISSQCSLPDITRKNELINHFFLPWRHLIVCLICLFIFSPNSTHRHQTPSQIGISLVYIKIINSVNEQCHKFFPNIHSNRLSLQRNWICFFFSLKDLLSTIFS